MKGTLRHKSGLEIPNVERTDKWEDEAFNARLVPGTDDHYFVAKQGWTFEPNPPELPEGEGYAVIGGGYYPIIYTDGKWRQTGHTAPHAVSEETVLARLRDPNIKLYDDDGKDITPKEEA